MAKIFLNPSNEAFNKYENGGNEEQYMNLIVDAMIPYLRASGIQFERSNPWDSLSETIERINEDPVDLILSLQSASAPPELSGFLQGPEIYYYAFNSRGQSLAQLIADNLKTIYPKPDLIIVIPDKTHLVLRDAHPVSVLAQLGNHDNQEDAQWIKENIDPIARQLVLSIAEYLGNPFVDVGLSGLFSITYKSVNPRNEL